mgnify:CR=1 FL=1
MPDAPIDWSNPCARFAALQKAYHELLTGARELEIRTRTLDAEDFVRFQAADIEKLRIEMQQAEGECLASQGLPNPRRRVAIGLGYRRRGPSAIDFPRG